MEAVVREYDPARDASDLRQCFIELHEFERGLEPALPPGESVAEAYLNYARSKGIARIRVGVLARNRIARRLYSRSGFEDYHLQLQKRH